MKDVKRNTTFLIVIGCVSTFILLFFFKEIDKTLPNYATVIGTICSIIGLIIAYINIIALKKASIEMATKIENTLLKVNQLNSVSEISKAIKTNQEIQIHIRNDKFELAHLRHQDLKHMLLNFNNNSHLIELTTNDEYSKLLLKFNIDLNSMNGQIIQPDRKVDSRKVINNLEELSTFLTQFESKIKSIKI